MCYKCPICGRNVEITSSVKGLYYYKCKDCCAYFAPGLDFDDKTDEISYYNYSYSRNKLKSYLFYHKSNLRPILLSQEDFSKIDTSGFVKVYNLTPEMVENWYPKTFAEKIDLILLKLAELSNFSGDYINIEGVKTRLFFIVDKKSKAIKDGFEKSVQVDFIFDYLVKQQLVIDLKNDFIQLSPKGWERVYELQKTQSNNKNVFVSMAFNENTKETREAIRNGIIGAEYSPEFIDEIIHNHQIMPEMFRLIKESRFLILDISDPNYGAYYEAGYALGLGKEVIISCKESVFNKEYITEDEKKYSKYLKPHFDIAQKQILVWEDYADLTKKLTEWIKFLFDKD